MKNLKKLVIASFMLVIAFVAVVSSTYAWFTQGQDATVNTIQIGVVDANKSLLISKDNASWARTLAFGYDGRITPVTMEATSSEGNYINPAFKQIVWDDELVPSYANATKLDDNTVSNYAQYVQAQSFDSSAKYYTRSGEEGAYTYTVASGVTSANFASGIYFINKADAVGYLELQLYFQIIVARESDWNGTYVHMDLEDLHAYNFTGENGAANTQDTNHEAESSFRMAVVYNGNIVRILKTKDETVGSVVYDGGYGEGKQFAKDSGWMKKMAEQANAANKFVELQDNADEYNLLATREQAVYGAKEYDINNAMQENTSNPMYEYDLPIALADTLANSGCVYISEDGLTRTYHMTLLVWMEGWDGDNTNAASSCQYQFGLSFRAE